jgi:hypothetical protein
MGKVTYRSASYRNGVVAVEEGGGGGARGKEEDVELDYTSAEQTTAAELAGEELTWGVGSIFEGVGGETGGIGAAIDGVVEICMVREVCVVEERSGLLGTEGVG